MATIPIEVIVQDKASPEPTPTPSDPGETNIVVPDTGAGTVENGSNGGGIGSAVNIILPAIILVLAIGAIVAIMVHRYQKRKKADDGTNEYDTKESKRTVSREEKLATAASGTIAILAVTVLVGNLVIPATKAATNVEPGTAELDTVDKITIIATREQDSDEVVATVKNTSYATANLDFGYKVTASMAEGLATANLYLDGDETSEYYIAPVEDGVLGDNTWGYRLSEEAEEYLPMALADGPAVILEGEEVIEDEEIDVYYTAMVGKDMPAGTYKGEIEYDLVELGPTIGDLTYMQDFADLSEEDKNSVLDSMFTETTYILKDERDGQDYTVAKLKDDRVWMTKNLNLAGGSEITSDLSDVPDNYALPAENGFQAGNRLPASSKTGFTNYATAYLYNTGNDTDECSDDGCYSYYSWTAATAGSGLSITTQGTDAPYSICPKGWKLPNSRSNVADNSDFYRLAVAYGMNPDVVSMWPPDGGIFFAQAGPGTTPNFNVAGYYSDGSFYDGSGYGYYWSATKGSGEYYYYTLALHEFVIDTNDQEGSRTGNSIRCFVR